MSFKSRKFGIDYDTLVYTASKDLFIVQYFKTVIIFIGELNFEGAQAGIIVVI